MLRFFALAALVAADPAAAQTQPAPQGGQAIVAVPPLPTPKIEKTSVGETHAVGLLVAEVIAADLRSSGVLAPTGPTGLRVYSYPEVTGPMFQQWRSVGAKALVTGFVQARSEDRLTIGCYLFDIEERREVARKGFVVPASEWRRAAHRCADAVYTGLTGKPGMFDSRIVYVAESGAVGERQKRVAIMEADGSNHRFLTDGTSMAVSPILSPDGERVAYTSFASRMPQVRILDASGGGDRPLLPGTTISFAPTFSPDGKRLLFSMAANGNTDLYLAGIDGSGVQRLTSTPGADTSASFSPDGKRIVFQSDRSGTPQLYVMNADGSGLPQRISFGGGAYGSPVWSPAGDLIAFTRGGGIGVMTTEGRDERLLTTSPNDQEPAWAPNGQQLLFYRAEAGGRRMSLMSVPLSGGAASVKVTPQDGSDPNWTQVQE